MLFVYLCCLDCSGGNAAICSDNSSCDSNEMCECDQSYFSPSGTNTDCRRVDGKSPTGLCTTMIVVCATCKRFLFALVTPCCVCVNGVKQSVLSVCCCYHRCLS